MEKSESRRRLSGPSQGDAAAGLMKIRGATAAAVAELGQRSDNARRKKESVRRECWAGLFIRQGHKWARDSRRPRRGYLPPRHLDFRNDNKAKIRCGSGGVKNGLNGG